MYVLNSSVTLRFSELPFSHLRKDKYSIYLRELRYPCKDFSILPVTFITLQKKS